MQEWRNVLEENVIRDGENVIRDGENVSRDGENIFSEEEKKIRERFFGRTPGYPEYPMRQTSAVLIPLLEENGETRILFEKRASSLHAQPGEICFPGGRFEKGENAVQAAVRETKEELLIGSRQIEILGEMDGVMGPAGAPVWPVVGALRDYQNTWSGDEVDHTFTIPLDWFREHKPETYVARVVTQPSEDFPFELIPDGKNYPWHPKKHLVYFYRTEKGVIWGLTGHILASFISRYAGTDLPDYLPYDRTRSCI